MRRYLLLLLPVIAGAVMFPVSPASAHRSGCHRWHSCPSDTGSYVCGDTGYTSGCPTTWPTTTYWPTTSTTVYRPTTSTTVYRPTTSTTVYRPTTSTTAYRPTTTTRFEADEVSEASSSGDAVLGGLAVGGGIAALGFRALRRRDSDQRSWSMPVHRRRDWPGRGGRG